jgi:TetR/AcrR family transcriptional regulator, fatty acid metabolism regulator protein
MDRSKSRRRAPRLSGDARVATILATARQLIHDKGYDDLSLGEVAERAGIVEGTIYRYFANKRELLERVAEEWFSEQLREDPELPSIRGTWNRLRHLIWRGLRVTEREPALARFLIVELRRMPDYRASPFFELNRRFTGEIRDLCSQAIASGEFHGDVAPSLLRNMIFGCIEHQTWAYTRGEGAFDIDAVADGIATVIYRGMVAQPAGLDQPIARLEALADRIATLVPRPRPRVRPKS